MDQKNRNYQRNQYQGRRFRDASDDVQPSYDYSVQPVRRQQAPRQQYPARQQAVRRQPVQRGYDNRAYDRRVYDRRAYDDHYNAYDDRRYNRQNVRRQPVKQKQRTSGAIITVRVIAVILLIVGLAIVGNKLYGYISDGREHNKLKALSADLNALHEQNGDLFGWISIDDTVVDYPVMYTPYDPEHYLHTDFNGDYSESGELFMDASCDPNGYHYLIYGHHMFNGSMFGSLPKYEDLDYFNAHRTFRFDTLSGQGEYEIFAVMFTQVYDDSDPAFKYYYCPNLNDESMYNYYVENVKALSIYDTGVTPAYGETIVTLSTCNYHTEDGRFVVCARKIQ